MPKIGERIEEWYSWYGDYPAWFRLCSLIFACAVVTFSVLLFGPLIIGGDIIAYWVYTDALLSSSSIVAVYVLMALLVLFFAFPIFRFELKRIRQLQEQTIENA